MIFVKAKRGSSNDSLIREFNNKIYDADQIKLIRDMQFHKTAAEIRKERKSKRRKH